MFKMEIPFIFEIHESPYDSGESLHIKTQIDPSSRFDTRERDKQTDRQT